jgi:hypothetical protein
LYKFSFGKCKKGTKEMIEKLIEPQALDNAIAVMKIMQLMGQLTPNDIEYVLKATKQVYDAIALGSLYEDL